MFAIDTRNTAMAVTHVFAETNVGDRDQIRAFLFDRAQRFLNHAALGISAARLFVFIVGNSEKQNGLEAGILRRARLIDNFIDCEL